MSLVRAAQFSKTLPAEATGLAASPSRLEHEKAPRSEGPDMGAAGSRPFVGSSYEAAPLVIRSKSDREV